MPDLWSDAGRDAPADAARPAPPPEPPAESPEAATGEPAPGETVKNEPVSDDGPADTTPVEVPAEQLPEPEVLQGQETARTEPRACPYVAADGWRSTGPSREHRCTALDPAAIVALEKQRRLCLVAAHRSCPTYLAARAARAAALAGVPAGWEPGRRFVRTAPVVVEAAPRRRTAPVSFGSHRLAQAAAAALALVVVVLAGSRLLGGGETPPPSLPPSGVATPGGSQATSGASTAPVATTTPTPDAGSATPATTPEPTRAATPEPTPAPSVARRTYTVKSGDTLSGIAAKFGVTVTAIVKANKIKDPRHIVRGQVLVIP